MTSGSMERIVRFYNAHKLYSWLMIIFLPIIVLAVLSLLFWEAFYEPVIYKYLWGPVATDAQGTPIDGIREGYNMVNTLLYGLILAVALFGIYELLKALEIDVDLKFFLALFPFIILGGTARALEDSNLLRTPTRYLFIAPIIYFFLGLSAVFILLFAVFVERRVQKKSERVAFFSVGLGLAASLTVYVIYYFLFEGQLAYFIHPLVITTLAALVFLLFLFISRRQERIDFKTIMFSFGLLFLLICLSFNFIWVSYAPWGSRRQELYLFEIPIIVGLALTATFLMFLIGRFGGKRRELLGLFAAPLNVLLFFGHFLDASATYRGIDAYGYGEKHVLPSFLIEVSGTATVMFLLKGIVIILAIYILDVLLKDELKDNPRLVGLIKFCILVLGMAPGTRDLMRLAMGV